MNSKNESGTGTFKITAIDNMAENFVATSSFILEEQSNFPGIGAMRLPVGFSPGHIKSQTTQPVVEKRRNSWACHSENIEEKYRITLPRNVRITRIPENINFVSKTVKFSATYKRDGNTVYTRKRLVKDYESHVCGQQENTEWLGALKSIKRDQRSLIFYE
jgi:hypothetical protein